MRPVNHIEGTMVSLPRSDIDTDQIIPQKHLKRVDRSGYGDVLFDYWAKDDDGDLRPEFPLNDARRRDARVLVTGANFGCGSSREHAVWALLDRGIEAVIATSFADIFKNNSVDNGLLTVTLPASTIEELHRLCSDHELRARISLEDQTVMVGDRTWHFDIDTESRTRLLAGLDPIAVTLISEDAISRFEAHRPDWMPSIG